MPVSMMSPMMPTTTMISMSVKAAERDGGDGWRIACCVFCLRGRPVSRGTESAPPNTQYTSRCSALWLLVSGLIAASSRDIRRHRKHGREHAQQEKPHADRHNDDHHRLDHVHHHLERVVQFH